MGPDIRVIRIIRIGLGMFYTELMGPDIRVIRIIRIGLGIISILMVGIKHAVMDSELMRYRVDGPAQTIYQLQQNQVTHLLFWKNVLVSNNLIK